MTFERTHDMGLVRSILTEQRCYRRMANDAAPPIETFKIKNPEAFTAVLAKDEEAPIAVFFLLPCIPGVSEVHFCFLPDAWGRTEPISVEFMDWVWRETSLYLLRGPVPSYNRLALRLAAKAGFRLTERIPSGGTHHGKPFDLLITTAGRQAAT